MKKRILFILHLPPPVHGSSIVGEQIKCSRIINTSIDAHYVNIGTTISLAKIGKNKILKFFKFLVILKKILFELLKWKPDICYFAINARGIAFYRDFTVIVLLKIFRIKLIYHFHNKGVSCRQNMFVDHLLYKYAFSNAEVILLSKLLYSDIQKYVQKEHVHYCPNGIPEKNSIHEQKEKRDNVSILYLSNMMKAKGVFVLLDACKILYDKKLHFNCNFVGAVGDISENEFNEKVNSLSLNDCINFVGKKVGDEKENFLAKADIFTFPTYSEAFGIVNLEAMQFSLPIVSTFEGGIPDVVENGITGFLVPKNDAVALAEKLEVLIKNPGLRKQMGDLGYEKYKREFTINVFENKFLNIINSIEY